MAIPATVALVLRQQELRGRAAPATTLAFEPTSVSKNVGETFTLTITINTGSNSVSGAELHIQYDSSKLTAISIDIASSPFLPRVLVDGSVSSGFAFITLGSNPSEPKRGTGTLATITFRAAAQTGGAPTLVRFTTETRVAGTGEAGDVLASQPAPASVTINVPSPTATPTPTPSPTPATSTQTPTPTPRGGVGGVTTPTPRGNIGIGKTGPTVPPASVQKGGPTIAPIPVTAEVGPTTILTLGGIALFLLGAVLLAL